MKQGKTEKAVFAKLSTEKVEKVELSSVGEVKSLMEKTNADTKALNEILSGNLVKFVDMVYDSRRTFQRDYVMCVTLDREINEALDKNAQNVDQLDYAISDLEQKAKEIGMSVNDIPVAKEAIKNISTYEQSFSKLISLQRRVEEILSSFKDPR